MAVNHAGIYEVEDGRGNTYVGKSDKLEWRWWSHCATAFDPTYQRYPGYDLHYQLRALGALDGVSYKVLETTTTGSVLVPQGHLVPAAAAQAQTMGLPPIALIDDLECFWVAKRLDAGVRLFNRPLTTLKGVASGHDRENPYIGTMVPTRAPAPTKGKHTKQVRRLSVEERAACVLLHGMGCPRSRIAHLFDTSHTTVSRALREMGVPAGSKVAK
jgi:hypothetical protein